MYSNISLFLFPISLMLSLLFIRLSHPLAMGLTLLCQTINISLLVGIQMNSFWFSYMLFLIFLGGMLVLFTYIASLASNELFKFQMNSVFTWALLICLFMAITMFIDPIISTNSIQLPITKMNSNLFLQTFISWFYNSPTFILTLFIALYLLLTLIIVVKITSLFKGPLRLSN